jgi:hypothetical protein
MFLVSWTEKKLLKQSCGNIAHPMYVFYFVL